MNQIIKQINTIICFKIQKKSHACVVRILNLQFVYMNEIIKQVNAINFVLKELVATTMVHVFIYTPYTNQLINQVNQISFKYQKLACYLY